ncbi:MAG: MFS transporter [Actinomycetales bacterium]|nr:MFS transporter [Actinomycetales bacterium]
MLDVLQETPSLTRRLLFGNFLSSLGSGLTMPLLIVYLHEVRGFSLVTAALVISWMSIFGLVATGPAGAAIDRFGPKPVMTIGLTIITFATASWGIVQTPAQAYFVGALVALGQSGLWPAQNTLVARMVEPDKRQNVFGISFMFLNLGLGIGGLASALIVDLNDPSSFIRLYLIDACSYVLYAAVMLTLPNLKAEELREIKTGSYRELLNDRRLIYYFISSILMLTCGYGSMMDAGVAPLMTSFANQSAKVLGPIWAINTFVIVAGQLFVIQRIKGKSRSRMLQAICLLWALSWLILGLGLKLPSLWPAIMAGIAIGIFAIGEMIWSPVGPAIPNDLAPEHLRGRYNAVSSLNWTVSGAIGPAIGGLMLNHNLVYQWIGLMILGFVISAILAEGLRKRLTPSQDGRG